MQITNFFLYYIMPKINLRFNFSQELLLVLNVEVVQQITFNKFPLLYKCTIFQTFIAQREKIFCKQNKKSKSVNVQ